MVKTKRKPHTYGHPKIDDNVEQESAGGAHVIRVRIEHGEEEEAEYGRVHRVVEDEKQREHRVFGELKESGVGYADERH